MQFRVRQYHNLLFFKFRFVQAFNVDAYTSWKGAKQEPVNDRVTEKGNIYCIKYEGYFFFT